MIIGSVAAKFLIPSWREPKDLDVFTPDASQISEPKWLDGGLRVEPFWHGWFEGVIDPSSRYATLDELYTVKVSHSYWELKNKSWTKHIEDARALKDEGARLIPELHDVLYAVWVDQHGAKKVNLDEESDDFFADAVRRIYDHDSIHASVAYGSAPMYERYLKPGRTVAMDMAAVKAAPFEDQVKLYREEVYATALERLIIPNSYQYSPRAAYAWALRRTITSLTKGWSARFLVENYDIFRRPDMDYVARHKANANRLIRLEK